MTMNKSMNVCHIDHLLQSTTEYDIVMGTGDLRTIVDIEIDSSMASIIYRPQRAFAQPVLIRIFSSLVF